MPCKLQWNVRRKWFQSNSLFQETRIKPIYDCKLCILDSRKVKTFCFSFLWSHFAFPSFIAKFWLNSKSLFIVFLLTSKTGLTVKYANKTCLYSKNSEITFSDLTFWRRGFKLLEAGRSCSSDATNLGQKPKMASFGRLWQPVNTIGECEMS